MTPPTSTAPLGYSPPSTRAVSASSTGITMTSASLPAPVAGRLDATDLASNGASSEASIVVVKAGRVLSAENEAALRAALTALSAVLAKLDVAPKTGPQE